MNDRASVERKCANENLLEGTYFYLSKICFFNCNLKTAGKIKIGPRLLYNREQYVAL